MWSWSINTTDMSQPAFRMLTEPTKADLRQWENPKTWPMLHQGIAGPIQSGSGGPPSLPLLLAHSLPLPPPPSCAPRSSVKQLPLSASVPQQPRPASLHHPCLSTLLLFLSSCIAVTAEAAVNATAEGRSTSICVSSSGHPPVVANLRRSLAHCAGFFFFRFVC